MSQNLKTVYMLIYKLTPAYYYRRLPEVYNHIQHWKKLTKKEDSYLSGANEFPYDTTNIFIQGVSKNEIIEHVQKDPLIEMGGAIDNYLIREF